LDIEINKRNGRSCENLCPQLALAACAFDRDGSGCWSNAPECTETRDTHN